jgi:hypothetical protein
MECRYFAATGIRRSRLFGSIVYTPIIQIAVLQIRFELNAGYRLLDPALL